MIPDRSYLVCATPRSGSTLVCHALEETGVAGHPEEYFEALRHSGPARAAPRNTSSGSRTSRSATTSARRAIGSEPPAPLAALEPRRLRPLPRMGGRRGRTTPNGIFGAKLMWGYFGEVISLLRNVPEYRDVAARRAPPRPIFRNLTFVRVVRANKVRQAVSLWKAVQTANWREDQASANAGSVEADGSPPYRTFIEEHRPQLRFHYKAIAHLPRPAAGRGGLLDAFFEHSGIRPILGDVRELRRRLRGQHSESAGPAGFGAAGRFRV